MVDDKGCYMHPNSFQNWPITKNNIFINPKPITIFKIKGATFVRINGCGKPLFANFGHLEAKTFGNAIEIRRKLS